MRLTSQQQRSIYHLVHAHLGSTAEVFVFGSRLDADKRGGDADLHAFFGLALPCPCQHEVTLTPFLL